MSIIQEKKTYLVKLKRVSDKILECNKQIQKEYQQRQKLRDKYAITLRKYYEMKGFVTNATVSHKTKEGLFIIRTMFYDNDTENMLLAVDPLPDNGQRPAVGNLPVSEYKVVKYKQA